MVDEGATPLTDHQVRAELVPMAPGDLEAWGRARPLPEPEPGESGEVLAVLVDGVRAGGVVLAHRGGTTRVQLLQSSLVPEPGPAWVAVVAALERHARAAGATVLLTSVRAALTPVYQDAGWSAVLVGQHKRLDEAPHPSLQQDRRAEVRPMTDDERRAFSREAGASLRAGMERAGVIDPARAATSTGIERRLAALADDVPDGELLLTGLVDGVVVGRLWGTLVPDADGGLGFHGHLLEVLPEHRGQGLAKSLLGAASRWVHDLGVTDVSLRTYGHDAGARTTFLDAGMGVAEVHLRKDLA